jgi:hypothetical protein
VGDGRIYLLHHITAAIFTKMMTAGLLYLDTGRRNGARESAKMVKVEKIFHM